MTKKNEALAVQENAGLAVRAEVPEYLRNYGQKGLEEADQGDITLPRLSIAQSGSPVVKNSSPKRIDGLEEGELYNTLTGKVYGNSVEVVPVLFYKSAILFKKDEKGNPAGIGGIENRVKDASLARYNFGADGEKPEWTLLRNFVCWLPWYSEMVVISMKSTATKVAKQWLAFMRHAAIPAFGKIYTVSTIPESSGGYDYFNFNIPFSEKFTPQALFKECVGLYDGMVSKDLKIDLSDIAEEDRTADDGDVAPVAATSRQQGPITDADIPF